VEACRSTLAQRQRALEEAGSKFDAAKLTAGCTKAVMDQQLQAALGQINALTMQVPPPPPGPAKPPFSLQPLHLLD